MAPDTGRMNWFDPETGKPILDEYVQEMDMFVQAMADGRVDQHEVDAQEAKLVEVMQRVEPHLDKAQHALVTELLLELSCYSLLQTIRAIQIASGQIAAAEAAHLDEIDE